MTETIPMSPSGGANGVPSHGARKTALDSRDGDPAAGTGLLVLAPMLLEANAVRRGLTRPTSQVQRAGVGQSRASKVAIDSQPDALGTPVVVMGTAAGLDDDLSPGDLVVAT